MLDADKVYSEKMLNAARKKLFGKEDLTIKETQLILTEVMRVEPGRCSCYSEFWQDLPQPGERCPVCKKIA